MKTAIRIIVYGVIGGSMLLGIYSTLHVNLVDLMCRPSAARVFYHPCFDD